ncbi:MAG TPA: dihydroneopterin aldolase [Nitrospirales bacterium]|jgi:FolB domain-containing protein
MTDRLVIEHLEFEGFVGIEPEERTAPQPLAVDIELFLDFSRASSTDDLKDTVDYAAVADTIVTIAKREQFVLIETLGQRLAQTILAAYPVSQVSLWVRKLRPPIHHTVGSVGARLALPSLTGHHGGEQSAAWWLVEHRALVKTGRALDLAAGQGRNALYLAQEGFEVDAWDRDEQGLEALAARAGACGLSIKTRVVDLEREPSIPVETFDLVVVFYYLQRNLIPSIIQSLRPSGIVVYETFLIDNHLRFNHPRHREFCLEHNELLSLFSGLRVLAYREGQHDRTGREPAPFLASMVAERPA